MLRVLAGGFKKGPLSKAEIKGILAKSRALSSCRRHLNDHIHVHENILLQIIDKPLTGHSDSLAIYCD